MDNQKGKKLQLTGQERSVIAQAMKIEKKIVDRVYKTSDNQPMPGNEEYKKSLDNIIDKVK